MWKLVLGSDLSSFKWVRLRLSFDGELPASGFLVLTNYNNTFFIILLSYITYQKTGANSLLFEFTALAVTNRSGLLEFFKIPL